MLQLVLLLIANALDGTIGQRGKWNGLVMLDEPPTGGQDYCRCCNIGKERVADRNRFNARNTCEHDSVTGLNCDRPKW